MENSNVNEHRYDEDTQSIENINKYKEDMRKRRRVGTITYCSRCIVDPLESHLTYPSPLNPLTLTTMRITINIAITSPLGGYLFSEASTVLSPEHNPHPKRCMSVALNLYVTSGTCCQVVSVISYNSSSTLPYSASLM